EGGAENDGHDTDDEGQNNRLEDRELPPPAQLRADLFELAALNPETVRSLLFDANGHIVSGRVIGHEGLPWALLGAGAHEPRQCPPAVLMPSPWPLRF